MKEDLSFWTRTWKAFDPERTAPYLRHLNASPDPIIGILKEREIQTVCDAGCGCGAYSLKLSRQNFSVAGFDVSEDAVSLAKELLSKNGFPASDLKAADILSTGYESGRFDAVVARDVIDHLPLEKARAAIAELLRITRAGGCVLFTLDASDGEYESEPHEVNVDGDYVFTGGKWAGMVFHPYSRNEIKKLAGDAKETCILPTGEGFTVVLEK